MKNITIQPGISIPYQELIFTASRSGGPGGQHANKADTRITLRWNVNQTNVLTEEQKKRVMKALAAELTNEGDIIIHASTMRSQYQNKRNAIALFAKKLTKALYQPKKRLKKNMPEYAKEKRLRQKKQKSALKKMRQKKIDF